MRQVIADLSASRIREVANAGLGRSDVLAFWFGESDEITPIGVRDAAVASIEAGETFYGHNLGLPELRQALARYVSSLHKPVGAERIAVTSSGVSALMIAQQALVDAGDEVVAVVPVWPNLVAQPAIMGARVRCISLHPRNGAWMLDLDELLAAITPATRVLIVNAPNNPTGWTLTAAEQQAILDHCRRTGTWIVSDEVYERLYFPDAADADGQVCAPSFLDIAEPEDRLLVVHSFSKSFLMTGWRLGCLIAPPSIVEELGKLIEFNTSCVPVFVQRAGLAALAEAPQSVPALQAHLRRCRDTLIDALQPLPGIELARPRGAMYAFLRVQGQDDSLALAKRLVVEHGLGLAPGVAFGPQGEGWLRWCFASRDPQRLLKGVERLARALRL
ncbi:aminotransferase class I and II [Leptothrix cholodnii SP-6]|uniref:Aminotransferase n=1 Tax=Leptothrix cholodnii (strain ATCC 51168 / LMG 8142 / SP-6) TaxID=395495 RepID=B1Y821_LEPCP|nr:pyridoxal phosphate-dependent aminotransferase [Leptothrix cholodnii]ACB33763.1 aminotransferase class I and II [Leptothrix cholodnii SP-6]